MDDEEDLRGTATVLSASSVTTFLRCGQQWMYAYVAGIKSPPSLKAARGIAAHKAVELDMTQKMTSKIDLPVEDMIDAYSDSFEAEIADGFRTDKGVTPGEIKDKGVELVRLYHAEVAPGIQPIGVELPIQFKINGQAWTGQIDVLEGNPNPLTGGPIVRDTKTTARTPSPDSYLLAMTGYALGVRQATGDIEADVVLDYLVALKAPKYHEIRMGGPITDDQVRRFAGIVGDVSASIKAGRFVPNGVVSGACSWCGYWQICPAYQGKDRS